MEHVAAAADAVGGLCYHHHVHPCGWGHLQYQLAVVLLKSSCLQRIVTPSPPHCPVVVWKCSAMIGLMWIERCNNCHVCMIEGLTSHVQCCARIECQLQQQQQRLTSWGTVSSGDAAWAGCHRRSTPSGRLQMADGSKHGAGGKAKGAIRQG